MLKISEFARISACSIVQLRYYNEIDLFKPAYINPENGYRYYTVEQLHDLNQILALKSLGLSLEQIAKMLRDDISTSEIKGMLKLQMSEIETMIAGEQQKLFEIQMMLKLINQGEDVTASPVVIKKVPPLNYLAFRHQINSYQHLMTLVQMTVKAVNKTRWQGYLDYLAIIHERDAKEGQARWEFGVTTRDSNPPEVTLPDATQLTLRTMPEIPQVASLAYSGAKEELTLSYQTLVRWIEQNGYRITGQLVEKVGANPTR